MENKICNIFINPSNNDGGESDRRKLAIFKLSRIGLKVEYADKNTDTKRRERNAAQIKVGLFQF